MRFGRVGAFVLLIAAVLAGEWLWLKASRRPADAEGRPVVTAQAAPPGGAFSLVDHSGQAVTDQSYRGDYLVMVFGYTYCPDVCPTTLSRVVSALELLGPEAERVRPVFVSVDPERDTPEVLADYVEAFHPRMVGLTGSADQIRQTARSYRVYYAKVDTGDGDYPVDHSAYVYLVGPDGRTLTYFKHETQPEDMARAIRRFTTRQAAASSPAGSAALQQ